MLFRTMILMFALVASANLSAKVTAEETFSYTLNDGGSLSVANVNGTITVTGGDGDRVEIVALKQADDQDTLDDIEINISHTADAIVIGTDLPESGSWFGGSKRSQVDYEITVPAATNLDSVKTVNGEVEISKVAGKVVAKAVNGGLRLSDLASDARLSTVNGSIKAVFARLEGEQKVMAETVNGSVTVTLPKNADVDVSADTLNGGINGSDFGLKTDKGFVGSDLNGSIGDGSARLNIDTLNGSIKIRSN